MGPITLRAAETTFISVDWVWPKYSPMSIRMIYQYFLLCENKPYRTGTFNMPLECHGVNLTNLKPGTIARLHFLALYNPSELDRGVNYAFETLPASKAYA